MAHQHFQICHHPNNSIEEVLKLTGCLTAPYKSLVVTRLGIFHLFCVYLLLDTGAGGVTAHLIPDSVFPLQLGMPVRLISLVG